VSRSVVVAFFGIFRELSRAFGRVARKMRHSFGAFFLLARGQPAQRGLNSTPFRGMFRSHVAHVSPMCPSDFPACFLSVCHEKFGCNGMLVFSHGFLRGWSRKQFHRPPREAAPSVRFFSCAQVGVGEKIFS